MELPAHLELSPAWRAFREELRHAAGETTYEVWLSALEPRAWDGALLLLDVPAATRPWIEDRFGSLLQRCASLAFGAAARVAFAGSAAPGRADQPPLGPSPRDRFIPRYTFDQFIIGDGNRLAHAAALAVAEDPGGAYNPLFLYAPPGLGKTHLLNAIANYITEFDPHTRVRYTTAEDFTNSFIAAIHAKTFDDFKRLYREVDVLLIDDVQFLVSKAKTEEEFFHTFNALHDHGRQLVLTCDRLPRQLAGIESRLRERFESGLLAELSAPDRSTRIAILRKRAALDRVTIDDPRVFELIADRITDNVRSLEGALIRLVAHHSLTGQTLDLELASRVLDEIHPATATAQAAGAAEPIRFAGSAHHPRPVSITAIQSEVASHFKLTVDALLSPSRAARVTWPRQVAIHLARELTRSSLQSIGDAFGGRNHATVVHACRRVADRIATSPEDAADIATIAARLRVETDDRDC